MFNKKSLIVVCRKEDTLENHCKRYGKNLAKTIGFLNDGRTVGQIFNKRVTEKNLPKYVNEHGVSKKVNESTLRSFLKNYGWN